MAGKRSRTRRKLILYFGDQTVETLIFLQPHHDWQKLFQNIAETDADGNDMQTCFTIYAAQLPLSMASSCVLKCREQNKIDQSMKTGGVI